MSLFLLDDTLNVEIFYEPNDSDYCDNICIRFWESCPEEEKVFRAEETNIFITPDQAQKLAELLYSAAQMSQTDCSKKA